MKILIVNKSATKGGAAIAAYRLYQALKKNGSDVKMLVEEACDIKDVECLANNWLNNKKAFLRFVRERIYFLPHEKNKEVRFQFSPAKVGIAIHNHPLVKEADIIHLHWVNHGFLSLKNLNDLFQLGKPVVWTLHDMWSFTGGCHYAGDCNHYLQECKQCPMLKKPSDNDLSQKVFELKKSIFSKYKHIYPVACSQWLQQQAQKSTLLSTKKIEAIANPIDTDVFRPINKEKCRQHFQLPIHKKLLLFGAANINDKRKGINHLLNALQVLAQSNPELHKELELVAFGKSDDEFLSQFPFKTHRLSFINNKEEIAMLYNTADAFVLPSLQDNLPNTVMESLACGVPVVAFNIGGVPEMIKDDCNGYLVEMKDEKQLAEKMLQIVMQSDSNLMQNNARQFVIDHYSESKIAAQYVKLYQKILS